MNADGQAHRNQLRYGERATCHRCSMEIEWLGPHGWQGRGADRFCDESGAHPYDPDTCTYGEYPHVLHTVR